MKNKRIGTICNSLTKKILPLVLAMTMLLTSVAYEVQAEEDYVGSVEEAVFLCKILQMLVGTGDEGVTDGYLETTPERYQGAIMLLRLKGIIDDALNYSYSNNFSDASLMDGWPQGKNMLGYLKENSDAGFDGYPDNTFKPNDKMTAKQYYKVMLVALGYEYGVDYSWETTDTLPSVEEFADGLGMSNVLYESSFTIEDLAVATVEALRAKVKSNEETLADQLIDKGLIDAGFADTYQLTFSTRPAVGGSSSGGSSPAPVDPVTAELSIEGEYELDQYFGDGTVLTIELENGKFISDVETNSYLSKNLITSIKEGGDLEWDSAFTSNEQDITMLSDTKIEVEVEFSYITDNKEIVINIPSEIIDNYDEDVPAGAITIYDSGDGGGLHSPYLIAEPEHLLLMKDITFAEEKFYQLANDIDMTGVTDYQGIAGFTGTFDGDGYTISNLEVAIATEDGNFDLCLGFMPDMYGGEVKNLTLDNCTIDSTYTGVANAGFICGYSTEGTFSNCTVTNSNITSKNNTDYYSHIGGIVGKGWDSNFDNCRVKNCNIEDETVAGNSYFGIYIGGICGYGMTINVNNNMTYNDCVVESTTILVENNSTYSGTNESVNCGGIIGRLYGDALIDQCAFDGEIRGSGSIGGILGYGLYDPIEIHDCSVSGILENYSTGEYDYYGDFGYQGATGGIVGRVEYNNVWLTFCHANITDYIIHQKYPVPVHRILGEITTPDNTTVTLNHNTAATDTYLYLVNVGEQDDELLLWTPEQLDSDEDLRAYSLATLIFDDNTSTGLDGEDQ